MLLSPLGLFPRYNGVWKTRTPASPAPATVGYWGAVQRLETALQDRGHVVYDGHIAHCPEKVRVMVCDELGE